MEQKKKGTLNSNIIAHVVILDHFQNQYTTHIINQRDIKEICIRIINTHALFYIVLYRKIGWILCILLIIYRKMYEDKFYANSFYAECFGISRRSVYAVELYLIQKINPYIDEVEFNDVLEFFI